MVAEAIFSLVEKEAVAITWNSEDCGQCSLKKICHCCSATL